MIDFDGTTHFRPHSFRLLLLKEWEESCREVRWAWNAARWDIEEGMIDFIGGIPHIRSPSTLLQFHFRIAYTSVPDEQEVLQKQNFVPQSSNREWIKRQWVYHNSELDAVLTNPLFEIGWMILSHIQHLILDSYICPHRPISWIYNLWKLLSSFECIHYQRFINPSVLRNSSTTTTPNE